MRTKVIKSISKATSRLTISFDGWKANNDLLDLLGVVANYLDHNHGTRPLRYHGISHRSQANVARNHSGAIGYSGMMESRPRK